MGTSLIPIKGISQAQKRNLKANCNISDIAGLLSGGRTSEQRQTIADKLKTDRRYVDNWVKQAALWNIEGMTEDYAYLLIVTGIRCALDLSKINIDATRIALKSVSNAHPDHQYDEAMLSSLKYAAEALSNSANNAIPVFDDNDPEPRHLFEGNSIDVSGSLVGSSGISKITVTVTLSNGQTYENTTTFPAIQSNSYSPSTSTEKPSGRVDHPNGKGSDSYNSGNSGRNSSSKPSERVDHPGMTGGSSSSKKENSNKKSGSTGRRR